MTRDIKNIFENYRLVLEQNAAPSEADRNEMMNANQQVGQPTAFQMGQQKDPTQTVVDFINSNTEFSNETKQYLISRLTTPSEADMNDRINADEQIGQPSAVEMGK